LKNRVWPFSDIQVLSLVRQVFLPLSTWITFHSPHEGVEVDWELWLLIEKGVITEAAFPAKIPEERATSRETSSQFGCTQTKVSSHQCTTLKRLERFERIGRLETSSRVARSRWLCRLIMW
jgi:hypothetical protein